MPDFRRQVGGRLVLLGVARADSAASWLALRVDPAQALVAHVGIYCRGVKPAMAKKILDYPQVRTVVQHMCRAFWRKRWHPPWQGIPMASR